jgi:hypothetical protein
VSLGAFEKHLGNVSSSATAAAYAHLGDDRSARTRTLQALLQEGGHLLPRRPHERNERLAWRPALAPRPRAGWRTSSPSTSRGAQCSRVRAQAAAVSGESWVTVS